MSITRSTATRRPVRRPLAACLAVALLAPAAAFAAPPVVNCNDAGDGSLRAAVAAAGSGDVIDLSGLACPSITLAGAIQSSGGVADLTIRAGAAQNFAIVGSDQSRVFLHAGSGRLTLENLALSRGRADDAGGCVWTQADLTLSNVTLTGCTAGAADAQGVRGGAVAVLGNATLASVRITGSRADGTGRVFGGGLFVGGALDATGLVVSGNVAHSHLGEGAAQFDNIPQGGGLHTNGAATLRASTISGNTVKSDSYESFGGGLSVGSREQGASPASLTLVASTVSGNENISECAVCAPQGGGGIVVGDARLSHATVSDNVVRSTNHYGGGGGFRFFDGVSVEIADSTISGNRADSAGGGVIGPEQGTLAIARTQIRDNVGGNEAGLDESGGGVLGFGVSLQIVDSSITGNTSGADGGGVNLLFGEYAPSPSTIINTTISGNTAREGGGIMSDGANLEISNSTIAFNTATRRGAGISASEYTYTIDLQSTIVANNSTSDAANNVWAFPKVVSGANNLVPNAPGLPTQMPGDTLTADPQLLPLAQNGGPTLTHALAKASPAIDAGNNAIGIVFDQRGRNWTREFGGTADIGAFEAQPAPDGLFADGFENAD